MSKVAIIGEFSNEEIENDLTYSGRLTQNASIPKHLILPYPPLEIVKLPSGKYAKLAYGKLYSVASNDLDIELLLISRLEKDILIARKRKDAKKQLKKHYKNCVAIISPKIASGWNRWSENILELFINEKIHKVVWGSGNCGKSIIMAMLLYIKWRVNPEGRMIVIASKIVKDASARVFGYIKDIHINAPISKIHRLKLVDSQQNKAIYCLKKDKDTGKYIKDDRACIINLPVKVDAKNAEVGSNLLGRHPDDRLILAFDEGQELPASMLTDKIFLNWYTNQNLDVYAWGNPNPIDYNSPEDHDLLFKLGASNLSWHSLKEKEKQSSKTSAWAWNDTLVLHLAMTDSPKDDADERNYYITRGDGTKDQRLFFLAGKDNVERIAEKTSPNTPSWYSQVLGFPYLITDHSKLQGALSPAIVKEARQYPLQWKSERLEYYMGVDPSVSGKADAASIVVGRKGLMMDGRMGIDLMKGEGCRNVKLVEGTDFTDSIIETMWELSKTYSIPLKNISIETHGVGEVLRYALQRHIEAGKWKDEFRNGDSYFIVNPTIGPTDRPLFKILGHMLPANELVGDISTEYWLAVRCLFLSRQIFNVPDFILQQFYSRQLMTRSSSTKYKLEGKYEMRKRGIHSPNDADALSNLVELIRRHGFKYRFYNKGGYSPYFGETYEANKLAKKSTQAMGIVTRMLQIGDNFSTTVKKTRHSIDTI